MTRTDMAPKRDIHEKCEGCGETVARLVPDGIAWNPSACTCPKAPGLLQAPPRTVSLRAANFIPAEEPRTVDQVFQQQTDEVHHKGQWFEQEMKAGKWYFIDETQNIGGGPYDTEAEARAMLKKYCDEILGPAPPKTPHSRDRVRPRVLREDLPPPTLYDPKVEKIADDIFAALKDIPEYKSEGHHDAALHAALVEAAQRGMDTGKKG